MQWIQLIFLLASTTQPSAIRFAPDPVSFGTIHQQPTQDLRIDVRLTNTTSAPLRIARIGTDCHCTTADFPQPRTLASGESILVPLYLNKSRIRAGDERMSMSVFDESGAIIATVPVTYRVDGPATAPDEQKDERIDVKSP